MYLCKAQSNSFSRRSEAVAAAVTCDLRSIALAIRLELRQPQIRKATDLLRDISREFIPVQTKFLKPGEFTNGFRDRSFEEVILQVEILQFESSRQLCWNRTNQTVRVDTKIGKVFNVSKLSRDCSIE